MKQKIKIKVNNEEVEIEIDLTELLVKAQERTLTNDDIQNLFNYLLSK
jgi:hypothetical protein